MATRKFLGQAATVALIRTYTPASVGIGNTFTLTCNSKTVTFTATAATVANVTAGLVALLNSATALPPTEFLEVTWTDESTHVKGVAATPGTPFTITSSATGGTATFFAATSTANGSPSDLDNTANWSAATKPTTGDTVIFENSAVDVLYGLDQSANTGMFIFVEPTFTGNFGLPEITSTGYAEYRGTYLKYGISTLKYAGKGSRAKFNAGSTACTATINDTGGSAEPGIESVLLRGTSITAVNHNKGSVGVAIFGAEAGGSLETSTVTTAKCSSGATLRLGTACAVTTVVNEGGTISLNQNVTTLTNNAGNVTQNLLTGTVGTITNAGTYTHNSSGTITTYVANGGTLDLGKALPAVTITNASVKTGSKILDPDGRATFSFGIILTGCRLNQVTLEVGLGKTISIS